MEDYRVGMRCPKVSIAVLRFWVSSKHDQILHGCLLSLDCGPFIFCGAGGVLPP